MTLSRPSSFKDDTVYLYQVSNVDGDCQPITVVKFLDYDPCPAFVIVQIMDGRRLRCLREYLFSIGDKGLPSNDVQLAGLFRRHLDKSITVELDNQD